MATPLIDHDPARPRAFTGQARRGTRRRTLLLAAAAALAALPAAAQDVEVLSELTGRPLPAGYYERIRKQPDAFETRYEWRGRGAAARETANAEAGGVTVEGTLRMVVMNLLFADSGEPPVSAGSMQQQLFGANPQGSLTDFYREISGGRLTITGTALPWVRTGFTAADAAGASWGLGLDNNLGYTLYQALVQLDATVNFAQYDNDGPDNQPNSGDDDGRVDLAFFQFPQTAASCGNQASIWPHRSALIRLLGVPYATDDLSPSGQPILVDDYHVGSAVNCDGTPQSIATLAHETGHALGLPDLYDASNLVLAPGQRRWVLGCWTLMAAGAWGCGDGATFAPRGSPPHMGPWEKVQLGWMEPRVTQGGWRREYVLRPVQTSGDALQVPLVRDDEYLLLEYRPNAGFDRELPAAGVLVYHVEVARPFERGCVTCFPVYHVSLVEADGDSALLKRPVDGGNRGVAGDVFGGRRTLNDFTQPSLRWNSGSRSNVHLEIDEADGVARVRVTTPPVVGTGALLSPVLGTPGLPPSADELAALDLFGNRNGRYDMGDLRAYMRIRPGTVVQRP